MKPLDLLTIGEVALLWNVSVKTVRRAITDGRLQVIRHNQRVLRVEADLAYALARGHVHK